MTLGKALRAAREKAGLSQDDLASRLSLPIPRISELENDRANPTLARLQELAKALQVPLWKLLKALG